MGELINFGKAKNERDLGENHNVHPMLLEALYAADNGSGDSLELLDQYLAELHSGIPVVKAMAHAIVRARQIAASADILEA